MSGRPPLATAPTPGTAKTAEYLLDGQNVVQEIVRQGTNQTIAIVTDHILGNRGESRTFTTPARFGTKNVFRSIGSIGLVVNQGGVMSKTSKPFIVYAAGSPNYPATVFGSDVNKGSSAASIPGSAIVVSGGDLLPATDGDAVNTDISLSGLFGVTNDGSDLRFAGRVIGALLESDDTVTMVYRKTRSRGFHWAAAASELGFQVWETADAGLCRGPGCRLVQLDWFEQSLPYYVIASQGQPSALEALLIRAASGVGGNLHSAMRAFWNAGRNDPTVYLKQMSECHLFAGIMSVPDGANLFVARAETSKEDIHRVMHDAALAVQIPLLYAGSIEGATLAGASFLEFAAWLERHPIPAEWTCV